MNNFNDGILKEMYLQYDIPCDRLVSNPELLHRFTRDYANRSGNGAEAAQLALYMLYLRKRGEENGGLPRLRRTYNGRN